MRKSLITVLLMFTAMLILVSCKPDGNTTGGNGNSTGNSSGDVIFDNSTSLYIVYNEENVPFSVAERVWNSVRCEKLPFIIYDTQVETLHEIVIGPTSREISKDAYKRLEHMANKSEYAQFLIYSNGNSIAIAYEDNEFAKEMAVTYFIENYLDGYELKVSPGVDFSSDILTVQEERDKVLLDKYWTAVEEKLGEDITDQLKEHYNLYTDNLITWYANLYEPYVCVCDGECKNTEFCGGGGFYYSNSARNTTGYLPDIESTNQALGTIHSSGMSGGEPYSAVIPEWMQQQIVRFVKIRQDRNGYFYHPQWTKDAVDAQVSRRSRDLDWAGSILYNFGASPTYDTPDGGKGDGMLWDGTPAAGEKLTGRLSGHSVAVAVSAVLNKFTGTSYPVFLENEATFSEYLNSLDIDNRSYHVGNELTALVDEINARDKVIGGGLHPLADVMINYLNAHQNSENGLWSQTVDYYAVNGLFKITGCYTNTGHPMPHSDKALVAAIDAITSEEVPGAVVDIYNTWYTINNIIYNIEKYQQNDPAAVETAEKALADLRANAVRAIEATTNKLSIFKKNDGSFSYNPLSSSNTSQGMPVAVPGTDEGDVNATVISTTGTTARMMKALGIDFSKKEFDLEYVPLYTTSDWIRYSTILEELGPVIKDEEESAKFITFTDDDLGKAPISVKYNATEADGLSVIIDPTGDQKRGNVLEIDSIAGRYNSVTVQSESKAFNKACYIFEGDICVPKSSDGYVARLRMTDLYAFAIKVKDGKVNLWDVSTAASDNLVETDFGVSIPLGEWFNIKVEYYKGDHDSVRMKLFINGELAAVNDNYYDQYGKKVTNADGKGVPGTSYTYFGFSTMTGADIKILLDNLCCYKTDTLYTPYTDVENPLKINVDAPDPGEKIYGFDDMTADSDFPSDITVSGSGVSVKPIGNDKVLNIVNNASPADISIAVNKRAYKVNTSVAEMKLILNSAETGATIRVALGEGGDVGSSVVIFDLVVTEANGQKYLAVADAHDGSTAARLQGVKIASGTETKLTIEYYENEETTLIYIDGILSAASTNKTNVAGKCEFKKLNISYVGTKAINIDLDDIKAERVIKAFDSSVLKLGEEKKYTFSNSISTSDITMNGASVEILSGNRVLAIPASSASVKIPLNNRSLLSSMSVIDAAISFAENTSGEWTLEYKNESGECVFALLIKASGGKLYFYEKTASGVLGTALSEVDLTSEVTVAITWFKDYKIGNIYVNDNYLAATTAYYSDSTVTSFASEIEICGAGGEGKLYIDDMVAENKSEIDDSDDTEGTNPEEESELITFEGSSIKNLPSKVTYKLASVGAQFKVERTIRNGILTKVIALSSYAGGNDEINIDLTKKMSGANVTIFEADMYIDSPSDADSKIIEFYLRTKGGGANAYRFEIWQSQVFSDGKYEIKAFPGSATWFKFKIEYYDGGRIIAYVNGKPVCASENYVGDVPTSAAYVERLRIYTRGAFEGEIKLDNVSFTQDRKVYVKPMIEGLDQELGASKPVLDFEDGLVNESAQIIQGSGNGSTLKVEDDGSGNKILVYKTGDETLVENIIKVGFTKLDNSANAVVYETDLSFTENRYGDHIYFRLYSDISVSTSSSARRACFVSVTKDGITVYYDGGYTFVSKLNSTGMTKMRIEYGEHGGKIFLKVFVDGKCLYANDNYVDQWNNRIPLAKIEYMEISTYREKILAKFDNMKLWKTAVDASVAPEIEVIPGTNKGTASMDGNKYTFENGNLPSNFGYTGDNGVFHTQNTDDHGKVLAFDSKTYGNAGTYNLAIVPTAIANATKVIFETDFYLADNTDSGLSSSAALEFKFTDGSKRIVKLAMGKSGELRVYHGTSESTVVTTFAKGAWYNIRIEYYEVGEGYGLKVLIDGTEKYASETYDFANNAAADKSVANVKKFDVLTYGKIIAYFDNIVCTQG